MKALTIKQPWLEMILFLGKHIENRSWNAHYRGPLVLHAGKRWDKKGEVFLLELKGVEELKTKSKVDLLLSAERRMGCVAAVSNLKHVFHLEKPDQPHGLGPYAFGPFCWLLADVKPVEPVPLNGKLGLWDFTGTLKDLYSRKQFVSKGKPLF